MFEFLNTLAKGGIVMIPLGICSLVSMTVLIERFFALRRASADNKELIISLRSFISKGELVSAFEAAEAASGPVACVLAQGLKAALTGVAPIEAMDEEALAQLPLLQRRLAVLDTIITVAPLLGLLGTVVGMITSFHILSIAGTDRPMGITSGIAEALIATATGLVIAIFSLVGYNWCQERVRNIGAEIERRAVQLTNWLSETGTISRVEQVKKMEKKQDAHPLCIG